MNLMKVLASKPCLSPNARGTEAGGVGALPPRAAPAAFGLPSLAWQCSLSGDAVGELLSPDRASLPCVVEARRRSGQPKVSSSGSVPLPVRGHPFGKVSGAP